MDGAGACRGDAHCIVMLIANQLNQRPRVTKNATVAGESGIRGPVATWSCSVARYILNYLSTKSSSVLTKQACYCLDVADAQLFTRRFIINRVVISAALSLQRQNLPSDGWCSFVSP